MTDREINGLVFEKIFGGPALGENLMWDHPELGSIQMTVGPYSTDIAAAWEVVEEMIKDGFRIEIEYDRPSRFGTSIVFTKSIKGEVDIVGASGENDVRMAICLAALRAKGVQVE